MVKRQVSNPFPISPETKPFVDLVQIRVPETETKNRSFGTGLIVRPGIIVTALHNVSDKTDGWGDRRDIEVYLWRDLYKNIENGYPAKIIWPTHPRIKPVDFAVLLVETQDCPLPLFPPIYSELPEHEFLATVRGFPRVSAGADLPGGRIEINLSGHASLSAVTTPSLMFTSRNPSKREGRDAWSGLSGGPLLSRRALLGVMREVPEGWDGTMTLAAEPLPPLLRGEAGTVLRNILGANESLLPWDGSPSGSRIQRIFMALILAIMIGLFLKTGYGFVSSATYPPAFDLLTLPGSLLAAIGLYREYRRSRETHAYAQREEVRSPTKIKIEKGLCGGFSAGTLAGLFFSIYYCKMDETHIPFWTTTSEIVMAGAFCFGLLGLIMEALSSWADVRRNARNFIFYNEIVCGIVAGIMVGVLAGPPLGWYFGQHHERPLAPPVTVLTSCIPGGVVVGLALILFRDRLVDRKILRNISIAFMISFIIAGMGNAVFEAIDANSIFDHALQHSAGRYSQMVGGVYYVTTIAILIGIHVGACSSIDRIGSLRVG